MPLNVNVAPNINKTQTGNFLFSIIFLPEEGESVASNSFDLRHIFLHDSTHISNKDVSVIQATEHGAIFSVDVPRGVKGHVDIYAGNFIAVNGIDEEVIASPLPKRVNYDTTELLPQVTYNITPPPSAATEVTLSVSARSVEWGDTVIVQIDFDFDVHYFRSYHLHLSEIYATKGDAVSIDAKNRRWIVPVTVPTTGEGTLDIFIPANSFRFDHEEVRVSVDYAEHIPLVIEPG